MKPSTIFTISRNDDPVPEFALHEQWCYSYGRIHSVRGCLEEHLDALRQRAEALQAVLATDDPERADQLLFDQVSVVAREVSLQPRSSFGAFEALMKNAFNEPGRDAG
ncbi:MAG TPA: hypothetical protein VGF86_07875 [Candidatus Tumulicola sp.]|jgi:hypothetical protein